MFTICTRSLARVPRPGNPKGMAILLERFRLNRQDFRKGWNYVFTRGRRRPQVRELPIVSAEPTERDMNEAHAANLRWRFDQVPMSRYPLDRV
ncbi:hypothetical protein ABZ916_25890 [Streptomyces sp. NPDC046853]|uniref:hypothetical protein n=1 Tax=Streptomyces sp. NPDC046853 TaxID=3154920 RepID=UPI0033F9931F